MVQALLLRHLNLRRPRRRRLRIIVDAPRGFARGSAAALGVERGVVERFAVAADVHGELPAGATRERAGGDGEDQREKQSRAHGWLVLIGCV